MHVMYICMCMCVFSCHNVYQLCVNTFICVTMHVHCAFWHTCVPRRRDKQVLVCIQYLHACVCVRARLHVRVCVRVFMGARTCTIHRCSTNRPPHKLSGGGFSAQKSRDFLGALLFMVLFHKELFKFSQPTFLSLREILVD